MKSLIGFAILAAFMAGPATAQEKPPPAPAPGTVSLTDKVQMLDVPEPIPAESMTLAQTLRARDSGLADAQAVLQERRDAIAAEFNRLIARLQAQAPAGKELSPQLTYVRKKESAPAVKEPPK